jgi:TrmH family RNA methyltransferase
MFPLSKLSELPPKTRLRKAALILRGMEIELSAGREPDRSYLKGLYELCRGEPARLGGGADGSGGTGAAAAPDMPRAAGKAGGAGARRRERGGAHPDPRGLPADPRALTAARLLRFINNLRHEILSFLGAEPAEWDFIDHEKGVLDKASRLVLPISVYLEDIRSPFNVGSMFRTAEAFGARHIYLSPRTPPPTHPRASRTARGCEKIVGWSTADLSALVHGEGAGGVFALELGGTPLDEFVFPARGVVLVGSEELGLSPEALALAETGAGRVSIPMAGAKRSLNAASAFAILMQKWYAALTGKSSK